MRVRSMYCRLQYNVLPIAMDSTRLKLGAMSKATGLHTHCFDGLLLVDSERQGILKPD